MTFPGELNYVTFFAHFSYDSKISQTYDIKELKVGRMSAERN